MLPVAGYPPKVDPIAAVTPRSASHTRCAEQCDSGGYPRIVIGCWQLLERTHDQSQAVATLQSYVKAGFTAFDTADIYGPSEEILGKLRREIARSSETPPRFFTKYVTGDSSLQEARRVNAKSRASLGAVPDMVQFHWWAP